MTTEPTTRVANRNRTTTNVYDDGYLRVEHNNYYVACGGRPIMLSRKEFFVLSRLALSIERIVPSEEIWLYGWGREVPFNPKSLRVYVYRLRQLLAPLGIRIERMVRVGYRLTRAESLTRSNNGNSDEQIDREFGAE